MPPHPFDGARSIKEKEDSIFNASKSSIRSRPLDDDKGAPSSPHWESIDGLEFGETSSLIADESDDSAFSRRVTDDRPKPRDYETSLPEADLMPFGVAVAMCTDECNRSSAASIPPWQSLPRVQEFDGIQFQGGESPAPLLCEGGFLTPGDSARDADDVFLDPYQCGEPINTEDSAFSHHDIDDRPRDDDAPFPEADWMRLGSTVAMCTEDEFKGGSVASIPPWQSLPRVQEFDGIQFQEGESPSPLLCEGGVLTPDNSARDAGDVFLDPYQCGEPINTVNYGVLESLEAFRTSGDSPPAGYLGATIGDTAVAGANVANDSIQLSANESLNNYSAAWPSAGFNFNIYHNNGAACNPMWSSVDHAASCNNGSMYDSMQPQVSTAQQRTSEHSSVNTSLMQQQYMLPQQQASQTSLNCNAYPTSDQWNDVSLPLEQWIKMEKTRAVQNQNASALRKLNVAYGIGKLLQSSKAAQESCRVENFIVRESSHSCDNTGVSNTGWEVVSIHMINPPVAVLLVSTVVGIVSASSSTSTSACNMNYSRKKDVAGRDVSAIIMNSHSSSSERQADFDSAEMQLRLCCALGELLHFLFSGERLLHKGLSDGVGMEDLDTKQPAKKQSREISFSQVSINPGDKDISCERAQKTNDTFRPLIDYGYPASISQLVRDLLSCGDGIFRPDSAFKSLKDMTDEVHLLFEEPNLLFERAYESNHQLIIGQRIFGRSEETAKIADAYSRVASTGMSEIVFIAGLSGSGKTSLVQKAVDSIKCTGEYFVERKFEQISTQSCINVVLSAFDEIAIQLARSKPIGQLNTIYMNLIKEFGTNFQLLARVLPSVLLLISPDETTQYNQADRNGNVNLMSICFLLQRFTKVVSASTGPGMLFLDDLQWADPISLSLLHSIFSGFDDVKSLLFVGSYRNNASNIQLLSDFFRSLSMLNTSLTTINLEGMTENSVNLMISDALGIVPRLCAPLSSLVFRKTRGNPFHVGEFLRTLVDKGLVTYSLRQRRWLWDVDRVGDMPVTDNVLQLIAAKMNSLPNDAQMALKVASCFGIKVPASIIKSLSETDQYSTLKVDIDNAVEEGLIDFDGKYYKFAHDKVREASYELIGDAERKRFHFEIGMCLYSSFVSEEDDDDKLFTTVEQVNYGVPSLVRDESQRIPVSKLNHKAGLISMKRWDFGGSFRYMQAARSLLFSDSWSTHYDFVLNLHYQLAKAAYPCGAIDVAKSALNEIDQKGRCLDDKLDAYDLLVTMLQHHQEDLSLAFNTCCKTLKMLGEDVPFDEGLQIVTQLIELGRTRFSTSFITTSEMLNMPRTTCKQSTEIMRFYYQLALVSFTKGERVVGRARGLLSSYYISRWVSYCLNQRVVCRHTPVALGFYTAMLVFGFIERNCREALRLGKVALQFLNENEDENELPPTYLVVYGFVACLFEPIQACVEMHKRAYEVGMQIGNISDAFFNLYFMIPRMIDCGEKLDVVKKQIDYFQQLAKTHSHPVLATYMQWFQDTITSLCDEGASPAISPANADECKITDATSVHIIQLCLPAVYLGQYERVQYLIKKWDGLQLDEKNRMPMRLILISYYNGLASAGLHRRKKSIRSSTTCLQRSIAVLEKASTLSEWNFKAKLSLLHAEKLSITNRYKEAEVMYDTSIKAAQASRFIHEEALACELSARHYCKKTHCPDLGKALSLYKQAKECYQEWGSPKKVTQMKGAISTIIKERKSPV